MKNQNQPAGLNYSIYHFFNYNNGEMLLHCDVIANHFHNSASAFDVTGVANNVQSPWHLWTALQQGHALAGTGALYCNEGGVRESTLPAPQRSTWNYPETKPDGETPAEGPPLGHDALHAVLLGILLLRTLQS